MFAATLNQADHNSRPVTISVRGELVKMARNEAYAHRLIIAKGI